MRSRATLPLAAVVAAMAALLVLGACSGDPGASSDTPAGFDASSASPDDQRPLRPLIEYPRIDTGHTLGPLTTPPSSAPNQAGVRLAGRAVPTNQWWSPALVGPGSSRLWAMPLTIEVLVSHGVDIRVPPVAVSANAIVSAIEPPLTLLADISSVAVEDHDDFSVRLSASTRDGATIGLMVAQGDPALTITMPAGPIVLETNNAAGEPIVDAAGDLLHVSTIEGRRWRVISSSPLDWRIDGSRVNAEAGDAIEITFVPEPDGASEEWPSIARSLADNPVRTTHATMAVDWDEGLALQVLQWRRDSGGGVVAVLPHQWPLLDPAPAVIGTFDTARGTIRLVRSEELELRVPITGFLPGVPAIPLEDADRAEVMAALVDEKPGPLGIGSYFGSKHLARLATLVDLDRRLGVQRADLSDLLADSVRDALEFTGEGDERWLAYDETWGGAVLQPPEFGSQDFNDHHFHYGYLIQAAATVGEADPGFVSSHGPLVDLLVGDILGDPNDPSVPDLRAFNPYLGHSFASGFVAFADGNNQESSSEAVNAWWAVARWAMVSGHDDLVDMAVGHYALEAHTARHYWLGELGPERPEGYAHRSAGIVWGGKVDFATWFDPRASAVIGIQLLPVNFGSIYRADPQAAAQRHEASAADPIWPDIAAMDLALSSPAAAIEELDLVESFDDGNTEAFARYWARSLASVGPPRTDVAIDGPYGAAFGEGDQIVVVGANPRAVSVEVRFRIGTEELAALSLGPGESAVAIVDR